MRPSTFLLLVVVMFLAWGAYSAEAEAITRTSSFRTAKVADGGTIVRYLKELQATAGAKPDQNEERISILQKIPGAGKIKAAFQKNPSFAKNLETFGQKRKGLDAFFKENPAIKKEIIVAAVLLSLIVGVPVVVKAFYPA
ncbi:hypothetical protein P3T76_002392 [Phytophthora citrophthora]|uniref:RxLR effector protein n=1 Tax=Phytophthora citrophthora TaxID=4793 RepID=A0AAD9GXH2_9STRA|nr:hypothetical protein P3T76_002392 [Phytophthora citrophthora]